MLRAGLHTRRVAATVVAVGAVVGLAGALTTMLQPERSRLMGLLAALWFVVQLVWAWRARRSAW